MQSLGTPCPHRGFTQPWEGPPAELTFHCTACATASHRSDIKGDILSFALPPMGAECPASHSGQSLVVSAFTSLSGVHCEPSLLPPLQMMLEQLLGDGSSAETALAGLIPQLSPPWCPDPALLCILPQPGAAQRRSRSLALLRAPFSRQGRNCCCSSPRLTTAQQPAPASGKRLSFHS